MQKKRQDIQALRAIAVLAVIFYHFQISGFDGGFVGVDVFFVISGFLITGKLHHEMRENKFNFWAFTTGRARRLLPAYLATITVSYIIGAAIFSPIYFRELSVSVLYSLFSISNIGFWLNTNYFDSSATLKPLLHTWSLSVEIQFYLFWPLIIYLSLKKFLPKLLLIVTLLSLISAIFCMNYSASAAFFLTPFRIWEFSIGGVVFALQSKITTNRGISDFGYSIGLLAVVFCIFSYSDSTTFPGISALLPVVGTASMILFGGTSRISSWLEVRPLILIGEMSYSAYLVHWPVFVFLNYYLSINVDTTVQITLLVLTIFLTLSLYHFIEAPFRKPSGNEKSSTTRIFSVVSLLVFGLAISSVYSGGWRWRSPSNLQELSKVADAQEFNSKYFGGRGCDTRGCETQPNSGKPQIIVIGDSHALALYAGLKEAIPEYNFVMFTPHACPMFSSYWVTRRDSFSKRCEETQKKAHAALNNTNKDMVILTQNWSWLLSTPLYSAAGEKMQHNMQDITKMREAAYFVVSATTNLKKRYAINNLVVLGGVPKYSDDKSPLDCMTRPIISSTCEFNNIEITASKKHHEFNEFLKEANKGTFNFIDPYDYICNETNCRNNTPSGLPIYSDAGHLSRWGAEYYIKLIKNSLPFRGA